MQAQAKARSLVLGWFWNHPFAIGWLELIIGWLDASPVSDGPSLKNLKKPGNFIGSPHPIAIGWLGWFLLGAPEAFRLRYALQNERAPSNPEGIFGMTDDEDCRAKWQATRYSKANKRLKIQKRSRRRSIGSSPANPATRRQTEGRAQQNDLRLRQARQRSWDAYTQRAGGRPIPPWSRQNLPQQSEQPGMQAQAKARSLVLGWFW
jgi:hypothetical protein